MVLFPRSLMINNHTWSFLVIKPKIVGKQKDFIFEILPARLDWFFQNFWPIPKKTSQNRCINSESNTAKCINLLRRMNTTSPKSWLQNRQTKIFTSIRSTIMQLKLHFITTSFHLRLQNFHDIDCGFIFLWVVSIDAVPDNAFSLRFKFMASPK